MAVNFEKGLALCSAQSSPMKLWDLKRLRRDGIWMGWGDGMVGSWMLMVGTQFFCCFPSCTVLFEQILSF